MDKKGRYGKYVLGKPISNQYREETRKINGNIVDTYVNMPIFFNSEAEILNFMYELGYTAENQNKHKYGTYYTFKTK